MAIKIEMLRCFSTVAQTGNLAEAAIRLGRTQSALSMTLKQLEDHLGQRLFESERKNRLTPLGEQVFELAQQELRRFDHTVESIETLSHSPGGLLRVVSIPSVAALVFPWAIETLAGRYPRLNVELRDTDSFQVIDALLQGQADVGIASGHYALNGIKQTLMFEDQFGLICSPNHPLARQRRRPTLEQVLSSHFVMNNLCRLIETPEFQSATVDAKVTVHNTLSLIAMVRNKNWVTILPRMVDRIIPDELTFRKISDLDERRPVYLLLRERSPYLSLAEELSSIILDFEWESAR